MAGKSEVKPSLVDTITAYSPFGSRSTTPKPNTGSDADKDKDAADKTLANRLSMGSGGAAAGGSVTHRGRDYSVSYWHRLHPKNYPPDCPRLNVQWYHAVDVAKRKPNYGPSQLTDDKPPPAPKKWSVFSPNDSKAIEAAFEKLSEEEDTLEKAQLSEHGADMELDSPAQSADDGDVTGTHSKTSRTIAGTMKNSLSPKVPVNEDYLFDVDIKNRELGPAYWLGPVYAVRRGTWFFIEGIALKPCDENLALQLEEGYIKTKPWRLVPTEQRSSSQTREAPDNISEATKDEQEQASAEKPKPHSQTAPVPPTHRLFGSHMNHVVSYQDETTAWLLSDDFLSRMSSSMYQRFAGGAHLSGTKVVRGYQVLNKKKAAKESTRPTTPTTSTRADSPKPSGSFQKTPVPNEQLAATPPQTSEGDASMLAQGEPESAEQPESQVRFLERQMSNLVAYQQDPAKQDEEVRQREEREIRDEYKETPGDAQDREIEHLVLVTHGIGQRLGARFETFNFIHDVNELRKTLKSVYSMSADLQALNEEIDKLPKNCRIQVLPICWRHMLDFPQQSLKHNRKELDLGDNTAEEDEVYPSLEDITVEGVPALRNIVADLALDVLLYQTKAYHEHISRIVAKECNRILRLFKRRNPTFNGKISLIGHSLGSAVFFDLLSTQVEDKPAFASSQKSKSRHDTDMKLDFNVESLVCFGSPIGLFQMLNGKTISGRPNPNQVTLDGSKEGIEDPFDDSAFSGAASKGRTEQIRDALSSSPKCKQLFNIFHPSDPISYRLEPLISRSMSGLHPQNLPYTKNSFLGAPMGHGITGLPARVGQSFSGLWSSFSSGIANNFINRSLGISAEDAMKMGAPAPMAHNRAHSLSQSQAQLQQSAGAGTNITSGGVIPAEAILPGLNSAPLEDAKKRKLAQEAAEAHREGQRPPTLIDAELETLYSGFQKRRKSDQGNDASTQKLGDSHTWAEMEERGRRLKREEAKVRALNSNGRVDYSIQEGAFDISFLQSIASHLTYWTDEDVCHFLISQLLSRQRVVGGG